MCCGPIRRCRLSPTCHRRFDHPDRHRDDFDFNLRAFRQGRDGDGRTRRRILAKIRRINFVYRPQISHAGEENGRLHHVTEVQMLRFQDRIDRNLTGAKEHRAAPNRLRIRPNCSRRVSRGTTFFIAGS